MPAYRDSLSSDERWDVVFYIWQLSTTSEVLRRKRRVAVRYSSVSLIREALPSHSRWRRRLTVAQDAALAFIEELTGGTQLGIVAFSDFAQIVFPPTRDKEALRQAIETLTTSIGTAIGSATLKSLDAISETNPAVAPSGLNLGVIERQDPSAEEGYQPDIIVLLTDGANTRGPWTRPSRRPTGGCGCSRSASERPSRVRWCARRRSWGATCWAAGVSATAAVAAWAGASGVGSAVEAAASAASCCRTSRPCRASPT